MLWFSLIPLGIIIFALIYKIFSYGGIPSFKLGMSVPQKSLTEKIRAMAREHKHISGKDYSLDISLIGKKIRQAAKMLGEKAASGQKLFEFEKWLYNNNYVINQVYIKTKKCIDDFKRLPHFGDWPRVYLFAYEIVSNSDGFLNKESIDAYIDEYQKETPFTYKELKALELAFNYALLEYAAIISSKCIVINDNIRASKHGNFDKEAQKRIKNNSYIYGINLWGDNQRIKKAAELCARAGLGFHDRLEGFNRQLIRYNTVIKNTVTSMRNLGDILDAELLKRHSAVYKILDGEGRQVFGRMAMQSREEYLKLISRISEKKKLNEIHIARHLVALANAENVHVGEFLFTRPYYKICAINNLSLRRFLFIGGVNLLAVAMNIGVLFLAGINAFTIIAALVAHPIYVVLSNLLITRIFGRCRDFSQLPRMDFSQGIPSEHNALIVVSQVITSAEELKDAVRHIKKLAEANRHPNIKASLLIDFAPADSKEVEGDEELLKAARQIFDEQLDGIRFNIFWRERRYNPVDKKYMGWERKRGAIMQLSSYLIDPSKSNDVFCTVLGSVVKPRYIIALDADSFTFDCREMIETMAHPVNKDIDLLTFTSRTDPLTAGRTLFARVMKNGRGYDVYSAVRHNFNQNVLGQGQYCGKGIYRLEPFLQKLEGVLPQNAILSHDLIEGAHLNTADSNFLQYDKVPPDFFAFFERNLRWLRGDTQLLPYLFGKVKREDNRRYKNQINGLSKWRILYNILHALQPISAMALIIMSIFWGYALLIPAFIFLFTDLVFTLFAASQSFFYCGPNTAIAKSICAGFLRALIFFAALPYIAINNLYAILITLIRLTVTRRNLLSWKTYAHSLEEKKGGITCLVKQTVPGAINAAVLVAASYITGGAPMLFVYLPFAALFILSGILIWITSIEFKSSKEVPQKDKQLIQDIAKSTWDYFKKQFDDGNYLVFDNYQIDNDVGWVRRTSPTNIGFSILACVCAETMGFIDYVERDRIISNILDEVEKLEKWHGNLYNWYSIDTKKPLAPKYVSTVDSGNLLAALFVAKQAVVSPALKDRIATLIYTTDLSALYDHKKGLFYIGTDTREFAPIYYDLLASEAHLTAYIAVFCGNVPREHWQKLSRASVKYAGKLLYSWGGGMFEYLMPSLFLHTAPDSLLSGSAVNAVRSQIKFAASYGKDIWGFSESQYNATDQNGLYQYRACGVNAIALKNAPASFVVSPYSAFLALEFLPKAAIKNIKKLIDYGLSGEFGMYEAIDTDKGGKVLRTYMSHHQGMILCAAANFLCGDRIKEYMHKNTGADAYRLLLAEPEIAVAKPKYTQPLILKGEPVRYFEKAQKNSTLPFVNLLTNGKYCAVTTDSTLGHAYYGDTLLSRPQSTGGGVMVEVDGQVFDPIAQNDEAEYFGEISRYFATVKALDIEVKKCVLQDCNGEVIRVIFTNNTAADKKIKFCYYTEPVLNNEQAFLAHPVFSNMFVRVERGEDFIYAYRRDQKKPLYYALKLFGGGQYEGNRFNVFSRRKGGLKDNFGTKVDSFGDVLEPVLCARKDFTLKADSVQVLDLCLVMARDKAYIPALFNRLDNPGNFDNAVVSSIIYQSNLWEEYSPDINTHKFIRRAASKLMYEPFECRINATKAKEYLHLLKDHCIDAARPVVAFVINDTEALPELNYFLHAIRYLRLFVPSMSLVICYNEPPMYLRRLHDDISVLLEKHSLKTTHGKPVYLININSNPAIKEALKNTAKIYFEDVFINAHVDEFYPKINSLRLKTASYKTAPISRPKLEFELGHGGFTAEGGYYIDLSKEPTPLPWSNIIATENFGTLITERGGGYTWRGNARENKLSCWANDPVTDPASESIYLRDARTGYVWDIDEALNNGGFVSTVHDLGQTAITLSFNGITAEIIYFLDIDSDAKIYSVTITNNADIDREIEVILAVKTVLGVNDYERGDKIIIQKTEEGLKAFNLTNGLEAYLTAGNGHFKYLLSGMDLKYLLSGGGWVNLSTAKPMMVLGKPLTLSGNAKTRINFALSGKKYRISDEIDSVYQKCIEHFKGLGAVTVKTPDPALDIMVNDRLMYQVLCSRFLGRTGYYQAGGAYGFRDQLQDCLALLYYNPALVRAHIIRCASHQYLEGDVQHWWHPEKKGTRTTMTDDLLWLPLAVAEYVNFTGDYTILEENAPYLNSPPLADGQHSRYEEPDFSTITDTVYNHCLKAIELAASRRSERGLSLIGSGDWNDALDRVGTEGRGESVWLSMFLYYVIEKFLPLVKSVELRTEYKRELILLREIIDRYGWDGEWYRRAYFDNGEVLGSASSFECKIDLLSQAWAVLSGIAPADKATRALHSVELTLLNPEYKIIKLLDPPFKEIDGGYITHYPPGVRENGGQYTHAALWFVLALIKAGQYDKAYKYFCLINPINHTLTPEGVRTYKGEPYAVSADVYSHPDMLGRCGWTYYTGSAAWMYKAAVEGFFGITKKGDKLHINPCPPKHWNTFEIYYALPQGKIKITVINTGKGERGIEINGKKYTNADYITLQSSLIGSDIKVYC